MKKLWLIVFAVVAVSAIFANGVFARQNADQGKNSRYEVVAFQENFESGATGWTHVDGAVSPNNWHVYAAGAPQANVWWMGDPALASGANIGGYYDEQYLVLDTPQVLVPTATPTLTFKVKYNVEAPAGATAPYTGWDACNVRISTNNGQTWTPISGTPAYNITSAYSFGFSHGEGPNIPGWGGNSNGWQNATFSLTAYAGQNVKIRFAFASDPSYSTGSTGAAALFGMMVDDIALGAYTNNGVNDGQMTWTSLVPLGGDLWHIATAADAPSPTNVMICQNASGTYNVNMLNYLISPPYVLPTSGDIRADFMIKGGFVDPNTFPEVDFFGWEISINDGVTWLAMSNPYGDPDGSNYVYSDAPAEWTSMTESYTVDGFITDYQGETVRFRWYFKSDADTPSGVGIMIDDFKIYNDIFISEPTNLEATVAGSNVELAWAAPGGGGGGTPGWLTYAGENNPEGGIGLTNGGSFQVAAKWEPAGTHSIAPWVGMNITQIKIYVHDATLAYNVRIYTGGAGNMVYEQAVTGVQADAWNTVTLTTPFTIPAETYVWVGYQVVNQAVGSYPAGMDAGPAIQGFGDMINTGGSWASIYTSSAAAIDANWNIEAYVTDAAGNPAKIGYANTPKNDREVTGYKVYRDDVMAVELAPNVLAYTDANVAGGLHSYHVTAMYGANESLASNTVTVFVLPSTYADISYNDGTSEQGYNVGATKMMAVKYTHNYSSTVKYVKVFVQTVGTAPMILRVFDNDGTDGLPGTQLIQFTYPATSIVAGWNYIPIPAGNNIVVADGHFYIAIMEYTNASAIGMDTSDTGNSFKKITTAWEAVTEGEVMIQAIVENGVGSDDNLLIPVKLAVRNFPNPFNPTTSIKYDVPKDGKATLVVYNTKGQAVRSLVNTTTKAGRYSIVWNGTDDAGNACASGVYFYRLSSGNHSVTQKMLLSK